MANYLDGDFYIVVHKKRWNALGGRLTIGKPKKLQNGEIAIKLNVKVPDTLFTTPQFEATVSIPYDSVTAPKVSAVVLDNVKEIIEKQTGMSISLNLVEPETGE